MNGANQLNPFVLLAATSLTGITAVVASSGFWAYVLRRSTKNTVETRLLMGLAYDKISTVGMGYIERGWISSDEYEDFRKYLYEPYSELGGNGTAERIMNEVSKLRLQRQSTIDVIIQAKNDFADEVVDQARSVNKNRGDTDG